MGWNPNWWISSKKWILIKNRIKRGLVLDVAFRVIGKMNAELPTKLFGLTTRRNWTKDVQSNTTKKHNIRDGARNGTTPEIEINIDRRNGDGTNRGIDKTKNIDHGQTHPTTTTIQGQIQGQERIQLIGDSVINRSDDSNIWPLLLFTFIQIPLLMHEVN